jgi:hypothetical protein
MTKGMRIAKPQSLDDFYAGILAQLRERGVPCAITGGLACVEFGVTEHTEDCDVICAAENAGTLLKVLEISTYGGVDCQYRKSSPPLDARWLLGGYTVHFHWPASGAAKPFLDVFSVPPRVSSPWEKEMVGRFAGMHTVAEMKRTRRRKDWDQATALGLAMLQARDPRGWLHIFDADVLESILQTQSPRPAELNQRPALRLAQSGSQLLERVVQTEIEFWSHLDKIRLKIYQDSHVEYGRRVLKIPSSKSNQLLSQHRLRVKTAEQCLPERPLEDYGIDRMVDEARQATALGLDPIILQYLPQVKSHFQFPNRVH